MLKKYLKNLLLFFSVLLMFFLAGQIWFGSYFLPDGYSYITSSIHSHIINPIQKWFDKGHEAGFSQNMKVLLKPNKIVLNHSGNRVMIQNGHPDFEKVRSFSDEFIYKVLTGEYSVRTKETISTDTYHSLLKGKTIYVDYGKDCDFRLFSSTLCDRSSNLLSEDISVVSGYIIGLHDSVMNDVSLYITDKKSNTAYRYIIEMNKNALDAQLQEYLAGASTGNILSYSFELNFHKEQENSASKVLFDPLILLDLMPAEIPSVQMLGTEEEHRSRFEEMTEDVLEVFSINSRTMRRYTDLENARVFVENNATLTMYPNGRLEYQTVQGSRGLDISNSTDRTNYDVSRAMADSVDFVAALCSYMPENYFEHLQISSGLVSQTERQTSYKLSFDYCVNGVPVRWQTEDGYHAAIEMEVTEGYLTSYRHCLWGYKAYEGERQQCLPLLTAADQLVNTLHNGTEPLHIETADYCYVVEEAGTVVPKWYGRVDGVERIFE